MGLSALTFTVGVFGVGLVAGWFVIPLVGGVQSELDIRLRDLRKSKPERSQSIGRANLPRQAEAVAVQGKWFATLERALPNSDADRQRHHLRLVQAGLYSSGALSAFFLAKSALMLLPVFIGYLAGACRLVDPRLGLLYGCIIGSCGIFLPSLWLDRRVRNRHIVLRRSPR